MHGIDARFAAVREGVITYEYDRAAKQGYIYLPGKNDRFVLNTSSIFRGAEGRWFGASKAWDDAIARLIE